MSNLFTYRFDGAYAPTLTVSHQFVSSGIIDLLAVPGVTPNRQDNYNQFDARFRMSFGNTDVTVFGAHLTDKRGVTRHGVGEGILRPRTVGLTVNWRY